MHAHKPIEIMLNAFAFQLVWFICVQGNNTLAFVSTFILCVFHFLYFSPGALEKKLTFILISIGIAVEFLIVNSGLINYANSHHFSINEESIILPPIWLLSLWFAFATTLLHSLHWLISNIYMSAGVGLLVVPFSYLFGIKLSGSSLPLGNDFYLFLCAEGILWSFLLTFTAYQYRQSSSVAV